MRGCYAGNSKGLGGCPESRKNTGIPWTIDERRKIRQDSQLLRDILAELGRSCSNWDVTRPTVTKLLGWVWLVSQREPYVRTCVWMCEAPCTHVSCVKKAMGGVAVWKLEGAPSHSHALARGDARCGSYNFLAPTCTVKRRLSFFLPCTLLLLFRSSTLSFICTFPLSFVLFLILSSFVFYFVLSSIFLYFVLPFFPHSS